MNDASDERNSSDGDRRSTAPSSARAFASDRSRPIGADVVLEDGVIVHSHVIDRRPYQDWQLEPRSIRSRRSAVRPRTPAIATNRLPVVIGPNCVIREHVTIHRGTARGREDHQGRRRMPADGRLRMSHMIASLATTSCWSISATLGGHAEVGEHAILGGLSAVQQRMSHRRTRLHRRSDGGGHRRHPLCLGDRPTRRTRRAQYRRPEASRFRPADDPRAPRRLPGDFLRRRHPRERARADRREVCARFPR